MTKERILLLLPWRETLRRLPQVLCGLWLFGTGIAMMAVADLGLPPWDVFHQGVAETAGVSLGTVIIVTGVLLVIVFVPLKERLGLGTILNAVLIGISVDTTMQWLQQPVAMWARLTLCAAGPLVVGLASGLYLGGGLGPGPRDGIMTGLGRRGFRIWKVRTCIELTVLLLGILLGGSVGAGTAWFAISIGPFVQFFLARLSGLQKRQPLAEFPADER